MKATRRLFDEDSTCTKFSAFVVNCEPDPRGYRIVLDQTAFFPEEGGQSCDKGLLGGQQVLHVFEEEHVIYHILKDALAPGTSVIGQIDWEKRFSDMQQHTGEHIVSGLVHAMFGYDNVGFHLGSEFVTMDYSGVLTAEQLRQLELRANQAVAANLPVKVSFPSDEELAQIPYRSKKELEGQIRIVEIPGYDICACCAPHVSRTGQIGLIKLVHAESHRGGVRVYMLCGFRALADYNRKEENAATISALLSSPVDEIAAAVARQKEANEQLRYEVNGLKAALVTAHIMQIPEGKRAVCLFDPHLDKSNNRRAWNQMCERFDGICGSFAGDDQTGYQFFLGGKDVDARQAGKALLAALSGKGGGSTQMFQGQINASQKEIEKYFNLLLTKEEN